MTDDFYETDWLFYATISIILIMVLAMCFAAIVRLGNEDIINQANHDFYTHDVNLDKYNSGSNDRYSDDGIYAHEINNLLQEASHANAYVTVYDYIDQTYCKYEVYHAIYDDEPVTGLQYIYT